MTKLDRIPAAATANAPVDKLAREVIKQRVQAAVSYWQQVAKRKSPRVYDIHQLRVWSRRSLAALKLFEPVLPAEAAAELAKILNKARKRAGDARDCDVLQQSLDKPTRKLLGDFLKVLKDKQAKAADKLRHTYEKKIKSGKLRDCTKATLKKQRAAKADDQPGDPAEFGNWFALQFANVSSTLTKQLRGAKPSLLKIHPLRIEGKRVRYALEIGLPSLPKQLGKQLYAALEALQEQLGKICDDLAAGAQYQELASELPAAERTALKVSSRQHATQAKVGYLAFERWWKAPVGRKKLLALLEKVAPATAANGKPVHLRKSQAK
ncbi:CHAD domain-containing protein [Anatilimnocola sp. NA78]|uniref:CHAD domain-containing protein n=1 Tax=Anatilimnocola sp. NA78 TaxID=3415683 RepID=UPI003CE478C4